jgi:hypothetical protein
MEHERRELRQLDAPMEDQVGLDAAVGEEDVVPSCGSTSAPYR